MRGSTTSIQSACLAAIFLLLPTGSLSFSSHSSTSINTERGSHLPGQSTDTNGGNLPSILQQALVGVALASSVFWTPTVALAAEGDVAPPSASSIAACIKNPNGAATNCISTKNVKQLDLYSPPWTFDNSSAEEVVARIKGVVSSDPYLELKSSSDDNFLVIKGTRSLATDTIELLVNPTDKIVTFRAKQDGDQPPPVSDFGAIRKEVESIRQRTKIVDIMGQGMMSADAMPSQNGPLGQLKAFYGLQSGQGFEDLDED